MDVFVDAEFSSLGSDPRLISVAFVADGGDELYIEFTSGWKPEQCSKWVIEHVLPMLGTGEQLNRRVAVERVMMWLSGLAAAPTLIVDSSWDAELISNLFSENGIDPEMNRIETIEFADKNEAKQFEKARQKYFTTFSGRQHHALVDAHALQFAVVQLIFCKSGQGHSSGIGNQGFIVR